MDIQLSEHFNYVKLIRFTMPSVIMLVFTSIYGVVDGFFVSNIVGKTPFAALNFIMPVLMVLGAFGFMFGTGGSALIAKNMGEGNSKKANSLFSMFVYVTIALSVLIAIISIIFLPYIAKFLGAEGQMLSDCVIYGRVILVALPFCMLQFEFQSFYVAAEKPKIGLYVTVVSGMANMILDFVFMAVFKWGIVGAALATASSQLVGGVIPLIYFSFPNNSLLKLTKTNYDGKALLKAITNGFSELLNNVAMSLVSMIYNVQMLKYAGENGVAAYGVLMYVNFIFISVFIGYSVGTAPVISYHYGAGNVKELKNLLKKSLVIISVLSLLMFLISEFSAHPLSYMFVGYDDLLMNMTHRGFVIFSFSFLAAGFSIFASGFFTALNDGFQSALIAFLRTMVFQIGAVLILPLIWKIDGIWISVVTAEALAALISFVLIKKTNSRLLE